MIIILTFYLTIISIIILKSIYKHISFIKITSIKENIILLPTSIQIETLPFFIYKGKIDLFIFTLNLLLLVFFNIVFFSDFFSNSITFCQDVPSDSDSSSYLSESESEIESELESDENVSYLSEDNKPFHEDTKRFIYKKLNLKWGQDENINVFNGDNIYKGLFEKTINETYNISNQESPFIFHLNYENIRINEPLKIFEGLSNDFTSVLRKQQNLIETLNENFSKNIYDSGEAKHMYKNLYEKNLKILYLISNSYNNLMLLTCYANSIQEQKPELFLNENSSINNFIIDPKLNRYHFDCLNQKASEIFLILDGINKNSKENYVYLNQKEDFFEIEKDSLKNINILTQDKNLEELSSCSNKNVYRISENKHINLYYIKNNIKKFHSNLRNPSLYINNYGKQSSLIAIEEMGFELEKMDYKNLREIFFNRK